MVISGTAAANEPGDVYVYLAVNGAAFYDTVSCTTVYGASKTYTGVVALDKQDSSGMYHCN